MKHRPQPRRVDREDLAFRLLRTWHQHPDGGPVTTDRWLAVADEAIRQLRLDVPR